MFMHSSWLKPQILTGQTNDLTKTVDYARVYSDIQTIVEKDPPCDLLEVRQVAVIKCLYSRHHGFVLVWPKWLLFDSDVSRSHRISSIHQLRRRRLIAAARQEAARVAAGCGRLPGRGDRAQPTRNEDLFRQGRCVRIQVSSSNSISISI